MSTIHFPRVIAVGLVALTLVAPVVVSAQAQPLRLPNETTGRVRFSDQVRALAAKLDAAVASRRISPHDAEIVQRELNEVEARIASDRDRHGGRDTIAERFDLQDRIDKIGDDLRKHTIDPGAPSAH